MRDPGAGRVTVEFASHTDGRTRFRKLTLAMDYIPLHGENGHVDDMTASIVISSSTIPAGQHVLEVIAWYEGTGVIWTEWPDALDLAIYVGAR